MTRRLKSYNDQASPQPSGPSPKRLLLVDDHAILRDCLRKILGRGQQFEVVAEASDGEEALAHCKTYVPDAVLLDLGLPKMDGLDVLRQIKQRWPEMKVLVFTVHSREREFNAAMEANADGYCLKECRSEELLDAVRQICKGRRYVSRPLHGFQVDNAAISLKDKACRARYAFSLSIREREIMRLVGLGYTNKQIATSLFISPRTVDNHCSHIRSKLGVRSKQGIIAFAFRCGLT